MNLTKQEILEKLPGISWASIQTYLARSEFSHIFSQKQKGRGSYCVYTHIKPEDLDRLKSFVRRRRGIYYK